MTEHCPTCLRPLTSEGRRICADCKKPIGRNDKFVFKDSVVVHRHCDAPTTYLGPTK